MKYIYIYIIPTLPSFLTQIKQNTCPCLLVNSVSACSEGLFAYRVDSHKRTYLHTHGLQLICPFGLFEVEFETLFNFYNFFPILSFHMREGRQPKGSNHRNSVQLKMPSKSQHLIKQVSDFAPSQLYRLISVLSKRHPWENGFFLLFKVSFHCLLMHIQKMQTYLSIDQWQV